MQGEGWDQLDDYMRWSRLWLRECVRVLRPGGALFLYGSPAKLWLCRLKLLAADELGLAFVQHISWVYKQGGDSRLKGMLAYSVRMEHLARYSRDMGEIWGEMGRRLDRLATRLEMRNTDPRLRSVPRLLSSTQAPRTRRSGSPSRAGSTPSTRTRQSSTTRPRSSTRRWRRGSAACLPRQGGCEQRLFTPTAVNRSAA